MILDIIKSFAYSEIFPFGLHGKEQRGNGSQQGHRAVDGYSQIRRDPEQDLRHERCNYGTDTCHSATRAQTNGTHDCRIVL